jgi:hypothetical protein
MGTEFLRGEETLGWSLTERLERRAGVMEFLSLSPFCPSPPPTPKKGHQSTTLNNNFSYKLGNLKPSAECVHYALGIFQQKTGFTCALPRHFKKSICSCASLQYKRRKQLTLVLTELALRTKSKYRCISLAKNKGFMQICSLSAPR